MLKYRILVVEDDVVDQMAFKRFARDGAFPHDYAIVGSVTEAREILNIEKFDVVITDYSLGDGSALDIIKLLGDIPSIVVTGAGTEEVAVQAMKAGAYDYIVKDSDNAHLKLLPVTIGKIIESSNAMREIRMLTHAIRNVNDSVFITDLKNRITFVNDAFCRTYGYREDEVIGMNGSALGEIDGEGEFFHKRKDGFELPVVLTVSTIKDESGDDRAIVRVAHNITERKIMEDELKTLATTDRLTQAFNRLKFEEIFLKEKERATRYGQPLSMIMFDIDNFKQINDTHGHVIGDNILKSIADTVMKSIRKLEYFIRWGGEEFMILASGADVKTTGALAERIRKIIQDYRFDKAGRVTISLGVTQFRPDDTEDTFIKRADGALYKAKTGGKNRMEIA